MAIAWIFPGQGSQYVGMGKDLADSEPLAAEALQTADEVLGFSLSSLCFEGPEEELARTENTQPAILAVSWALLRLLEGEGFEGADLRPDYVAGHSLGEYSALVAAGALDPVDALRVVRRRGQLMSGAFPPGEGGMLAVLGLESAQVYELCRRAQESGTAEPATLNGPGQVVVAGEMAALERVAELAKEAGARRTQFLQVSGPFHSSLMRQAGEALREVLDEIEIRPPQVPIVANATAGLARTAEEVREALVAQVASPVRWEESVRFLVDQGVDIFVEVGPGRVLSGLVRRIAKDVELFQIDGGAAWRKVLARLKGDGVG